MDDLNALNKLYFGKIRPFEEIGAENADLTEIRKTLLKMEKDFKNALDSPFYKNVLEEIKKIEEVQGYYDTLYNYECFAYGFKLGLELSKN